MDPFIPRAVGMRVIGETPALSTEDRWSPVYSLQHIVEDDCLLVSLGAQVGPGARILSHSSLGTVLSVPTTP